MQKASKELTEYFALKKKLEMELPMKVKIYFSLFESTVGQQSIQQSKQRKQQTGNTLSKQLITAFLGLSEEQKGHFLLQNLKFVGKNINKIRHTGLQNPKALNDLMQQIKIQQEPTIKHIEACCKIAYSMMKISYWSEVSFKFDVLKRQITLNNKKCNYLIDLNNYVARKSHRYENALVLEAVVDEIIQELKKQTLLFSEPHLFQKVYTEVVKCTIAVKNEQLLLMLRQNNEELGPDKGLVFLNTSNVNQYLSFKDTTTKRLLMGKLDFQVIYQDEDYKIEKSSKSEKLFKLESTMALSAKEVKVEFLQRLGKYKYLISSDELQNFSKKYFATYEKYYFNNKLQELISIQEKTLAEQQQILFVKGIQNILTKNYLEFMLVKVRALAPTLSRLIIIASIQVGPLMSQQVVKEYLSEYQRMLFKKPLPRKKTEDKLDQNKADDDFEDFANQDQYDEDEDDFKTVIGRNELTQNFQIMDGQEFFDDFAENQLEMMKQKYDIIPQKIQSHKQVKPENLYLDRKHRTRPCFDQRKLILVSQHQLFTEWKRTKNGTVVCKATDVVEMQKKLFKNFMMNMGNQIIKKKGIMNISIPVFVFRKESHLTSIARNFSYAPLFMEKLAKPGVSPLERLKGAVCQVFAITSLAISYNKPFNPILGETLQTWIDGCPIYLQQISHHPPIAAYLVDGRGYRIYGTIAEKISLGLNNVKGYSENPNYIQFDDGHLIQYANGKMLIKGLMFGEREFTYQDKVYAYDMKNNLFAEINFGPRRKSMLMGSSEPDDYVYGRIYKLKPDFVQKFKQGIPRAYPTKEHIVEELSTFQGIWTGQLKFDGVEYLDTKNNLPCLMTDDEFPLPSNGTYRQDLVKLIENDVDKAQQAKEQLEQIQRMDKKLRDMRKKK